MSEGWHRDPLGRYAQRYHNGSEWTSHVSNEGGVSQVDPLGTNPSPPGSTMPSFPSGVGDWVPEGVVQKANPFLRFVAALIDGLLLLVPAMLILATLVDNWITWETDADGVIDPDSLLIDIPIALQVGFIVAGAAYSILMVGRFGRTLGKMAVGLTIVRAADASPVGYGTAAIRHVASFIYAIPVALIQLVLLVISGVMAFMGIGQTLHDHIARTRVVRTSSLPEP